MTDDAPTRFAPQFARAQALQQQGQLAAALAIYQEILAAEPEHLEVLNALGVLAAQANNLPVALQYFERAIEIEPDDSSAHCNRGLVLRQLGQLDAALASFDLAIELTPHSAIAHYSRAETCKELGRADEALGGYAAALAIDPSFVQASYRRGVLLQERGQQADAVASYDMVIRVQPAHFNAHANRALCLYLLGRHREALVSCDAVIAAQPDQAVAHGLRAKVLMALDRLEESLGSHDLAAAINPNDAQVHGDRAGVLMLLNRMEEAIASFDRAITINPDFAEAHFHRGYAQRMLGRFHAAAADYKTVAALAPDFEFLPGSRLEASLQICDWTDFDQLVRTITVGLEEGAHVSHPFIFMALHDSARLQQKAARIWVQHACPPDPALGPIAPRARAGKLTIGYFSADLRAGHPVGRLLTELIELHDRSRFEIVAFSFGPRAGDDSQERLTAAFDRFIDVQDQPSAQIATLARSLNVDIAVDLGGHTYNNRAKIFALRAAPVQVNYLGYLGTTGAGYMDYIIADRTVVTPASESCYDEKIIYLPGSHQANDRKRRIADKVFTREELGLPSKGFVFCCFNTSYKIAPRTFAGWMRILQATPGSVLLLYADQEATQGNLRAQAARHGVPANRLVFGKRLRPPEYLARYRSADLFLDTFPYNAGTTASDALWAGLPVLTLSGEAFASRIAASLLTALGVPELITATQQQFEELAIELTSDPQRLAAIRAKIQSNRLGSPLFDTPLFARNLESAYTAIQARYLAGLPPDHIRLR